MVEKLFQEELLDKVNMLQDERKKKIIKTIISKDKWYMDIEIEMFISILYDLGIDKKYAIYIYKKLNIF